MEGLARRFLFYFIGFGLGCVMVWAMFYRNADRPAWLPKGRVLEFLADMKIEVSEPLRCKLACYGVAENFTKKSFWKTAQVHFKESAIKRQPCPEYKITSSGVIVYVELCQQEKKATLRNVESQAGNEEKCDCQ